MATPYKFKTNAPDGLPRWKEDLRLNETEAEQLYSMLYHVEQEKSKFDTINLMMKVSTYGAIFEHILKKALQEPLETSRNEKRGNPERLEDLFKHHLKWSERKNKEVYPFKIYKFIEELKDVNDKWNTLKHQLSLKVGEGYMKMYYLLNVLISYLSDTEMPSQNRAVAGFEYQENALARLMAEVEEKERAQRCSDVEAYQTEIDTYLTSDKRNFRTNRVLSIVFCIQSERKLDNEFFVKVRQSIQDKFSEFRWHNVVYWGGVEVASDFISWVDIEKIGNVSFDEGECVAVSNEETPINVAEAGLRVLMRYVDAALVDGLIVEDPMIVIITDHPQDALKEMMSNLENKIESIEEFERMQVYALCLSEYSSEARMYSEIQKVLSKVKTDLTEAYDRLVEETLEPALQSLFKSWGNN